jgi:rhamnogalacturonyl hydrolase YesR
MKRRDFLTAALPGTAAGALLLGVPASPSQQKIEDRSTTALIEKVKRAMLSMQRAAWEQGVAAQALLELGEKDMVVLMAKEAIVRQVPDGRVAMLYSSDAVVDPGSNGEAILYAARVTKDLAIQKAADRLLDYFLHTAPRASDGTLYHIVSAPQIWDDGMYMAPPFLAVAGRVDEALKQIEGYRKYLWNPKARLFSHIWDDGKKQFAEQDFWGVGNGWAAAGMVRVIKALPLSMSNEKKKLVGYVKDVLDGCLAHLRPDGLFHNVVDKQETFVETNLSQMLAYCIYRGYRAGWLDRRYMAAAGKMRKAAHDNVDEFGLVQGVCGSPYFNHPGTATEGQAFFLLMEAAHRDL